MTLPDAPEQPVPVPPVDADSANLDEPTQDGHEPWSWFGLA